MKNMIENVNTDIQEFEIKRKSYNKIQSLNNLLS